MLFERPYNFHHLQEQINQYKPYGNGFFKPNIAIKLTKDDVDNPSLIVMGKNSQHVKYCFDDGIDIVIWNGVGDSYFCQNGFCALGHLSNLTYENEQELVFIVDLLLEDASESQVISC